MSRNKKTGKYRVYISKGGITLNLGEYSDFEEACAVREKAEIELYGRVKR